MNLLYFIDRFSFKQILSVALVLAILFAIPTTVLLVRQQTRLYSSAHRDKLPANYEVVVEPFGQPASSPPKIEWVKPFLGKVDDVVFIYGRDFGQNPADRAIYFGAVLAAEEDILKWHNDVIEVMVPEGAVSGPVKVVDAGKEDTSNLPFIVYDTSVKTRVFWQKNDLMVENGSEVAKAVAVTASGQVWQGSLVTGQKVSPLLTNLPTRDLVNLALYNKSGLLVPFFVNPLDFGF